jgi:hypothetical protein
MKKIIFITLLTILIWPCNAQNPYHDALKITKMDTLLVDDKVEFVITTDNIAELANIASRYGHLDLTLAGDSLKKEVTDFFKDNPFLQTSTHLQSGESWSEVKWSLEKSLPPSIAGLNVANIAQGISLFMIDRAKKELTAAFFNRLQVYFNDTPEIQVLFPKTSSALTGLLSYHYSEMLPTLRANFHEDMKLLPIHFDDVMMLPKYKAMLADFPEIKIAIKTIRLISKLENEGLHPAEIIVKFSEFPEWKKKRDAVGFQNFRNTLKLATIFSQSLRCKESTVTKDSTRAWVHAKDVLNLIDNEIAFKIYLGLLYQQLSNEKIKFYKKGSTPLPASNFMKNNSTTIFLFQNYISEFIDISEKLEGKIKSIRNINESGQKPSKEDLYDYIGLSIDIIEYGTDVIKLFDVESKTGESETDEYISLARNSNDLFKNIYQENYSAGISNIVSLFETTTGFIEKDFNKNLLLKIDSINASGYDPSNLKTALKIPEQFKPIQKAVESDIKIISKLINENTETSDAEKDEKRKLEHLLALYENVENQDLGKLKGTIEFIRKYGLFIANMVQAKTPEEVQSVIEAAVLPVGSSSLKKRSKYNVSVQSYLGAAYNFNSLDNPSRAWENSVNVTAPIGVAFSLGLSDYGSASIFASLIDIGAIVDYELKQDKTVETSTDTSSMDTTMITTVNTKSDYKVELGQIFSPGLFIVYGASKDIPLALMFGCQYGPGLINISDENTDIVKPSLRWMASLTIDIPWFTLSNTNKTKFRK